MEYNTLNKEHACAKFQCGSQPGRGYSGIAAVLWLIVIGGAAIRLWRVNPSTVSSLVAVTIALLVLTQWALYRREQFIRHAALPQFLKLKLRERYTHLSQKDAELVERGGLYARLAAMQFEQA